MFDATTFYPLQKLFEVNEKWIKECKKEHDKTEEQVKQMEEAEEPDKSNACFIGCIMVKEGFVSLSKSFVQIRINRFDWRRQYLQLLENGHLNRAHAYIKINEIKDDDDEKHATSAFFNKIGEDLAKVNDTCSAGQIVQTYLYGLKKIMNDIDNE